MRFITIQGLLLLGVLAAASVRAAAGEPPALDLGAYEGKVVVVDFWASWCVPCRRSFPWMNEMTARYADDGLVFIAVNMDAERAEADAFLAEYPADFRIVYDGGAGTLAREFEVMAMPTSYVFDRSGNRVARHLGFKVKQQDEYEALIVETLNR